MTFKPQERYVVRRVHEETRRYVYLNHAGEETELPAGFGARWTNSEPAKLTLHQAHLKRDDAHDMLGPWLPIDDPDSFWKIIPVASIQTWN